MSTSTSRLHEALRKAKGREVVTPEEYARIFAEGETAYREHHVDVVNPYMKLDDRTACESVRAHAWEMGWWSACREDADALVMSV
jgi:hypothetical protein